MRRNKSRAFYLEALLLVLFLLAVLAVLVQLFAAARRQSLAAKRLTEATHIAANVSEAFAAAESWQAFGQVLAGEDALDWRQGKAGLTVDENGMAAPEGAYSLQLERSEAPTAAGRMAELKITVYRRAGDKAIYSLTAQKYLPDERAA